MPDHEQTQRLPLDATLKRADAIVSSQAGSRTHMMDARTGRQFALEDSGARVWALLESPRTVRDLLQHLASEFDVDAVACDADVHPFLEMLLRDGLLEVAACERMLR